MRNIFILSVLFVNTLLSFSQSISSETIPLELKTNANAIVRLNKVNIVVESHDEMTIKIDRTITVLNELGDKHVNAIVGYDNFRKIKKIEAIIYNSKGEEIKKIKKKDFVDHSAVDGGTLYSDSRVLFMSYTPSYYPYTVVFKCEIETKNTAGIPPWTPIDGYNLSVEKDMFSIEDISNVGINAKELNFGEYGVISNTSDNKVSYELTNSGALSYEYMSPSLLDLVPNAQITVNKFYFYGIDGYATSWNEFGDWIANKLLVGRDQVTEATKKEVLSLVVGIEDPIEKAKIIYKYVQDNTRYISVQVGIGGVQPIPASEVDALKYGDCKGLTNYTLALLKVVDVPAYYAVVEAGNEIVDFDENFYSLAQGNHIILGIPDEDDMLWVDCTSQVHPFGFIGDFTDNRNVLLVKEGDSKIIKTTTYVNESNNQELNAAVNLLETGAFTSDIEIKTKGIQYDNRFFLENQKESDVKVHYKTFWDKINYLNIESYKFKNNKNDIEFTENVSVSASKYATLTNNKLIFQPSFFASSVNVPKRYRNRKYGLEIQRGFLYNDRNRITIPSGYNVEFLPEDVTIDSKFGTYKVFFKKEDNTILYHRKFLIKNGNYANTEYKNFRTFLKNVSKNDKLKIVLTKTN